MQIDLTLEEAKTLLYAWMNESYRRYGKYSVEAPLYKKLRRIAEPVMPKIKVE